MAKVKKAAEVGCSNRRKLSSVCLAARLHGPKQQDYKAYLNI